MFTSVRTRVRPEAGQDANSSSLIMLITVYRDSRDSTNKENDWISNADQFK